MRSPERLLDILSRPTAALRVVGILALVAALAPAAADAQLVTGAIEGSILDQSGAVLPGATVEVTNVETGVTRTLVSDGSGRYSAANLQPGQYEVRASLQGFGTAVRRGLSVAVGRRAVVDLTLTVGLQEEVVVTGEAVMVETRSATVSNLIGEGEVKDLPIIDRDLTQLAFMQPGVIKSPAGKAVFAGQGEKMTVAGARGNQNLFLLDGVNNGDISGNPQGASGVYAGGETIKELQIITNNYSAEYRSAAGAIVSAVTKSGTNEVHGSAYGYLRNEDLSALNFFDELRDIEKPPLDRKQFGGSLGGPLVKDKLFLFVSYEGLREDTSSSETDRVPSLAARQGRFVDGTVVPVIPTSARIFELWPVPGQGNTIVEDFGDTVLIRGVGTETLQNDFFVGKLDYALGAGDNVSVTMSYQDGKRDTLGLREYYTETHGTTNNTKTVTARWTKLTSSAAVNELHLGYTDSKPAGDIPLSSTDYASQGLIFNPVAAEFGLMGEVLIDGVDNLGFRVGEAAYKIREYTIKDGFTTTAGSHELRLGGEFSYYQQDIDNCTAGCFGNYEFRNLRDFAVGRGSRFDTLLPEGNIVRKNLSQHIFALYFQDNWRIRESLTLNLGVRYENASVMKEKNGYTSQLIKITDPETTVGPLYEKPTNLAFSPRIGFAWSPGDGRQSLRGGFGIFYEHPNTYLVRTALAVLPPHTLIGRIDDRRTALGYVDFPNAYDTQLDEARGRPNVRGFQYNLDQTYIMRFSLTYQRQLGENHVATIGYTGSRGHNLWHQNEVALREWEGYTEPTMPPTQPSAEESRNKFWPEGAELINPNFGSLRHQFSNAKSWYNGLSVGLNRIASAGLRYGLAFTWSKSIDQGSGVTSGGDELPQSQRGIYGYDITLKQGLSSFDRRYALSANLSWEPQWALDATGFAAAIAKGWQINAVFTYLSGYPLSVIDSSNDQADRIGDDEDLRVDLVPGGDPNPTTGNYEQWMDPSNFMPSQVGYFGTLGRNTVTAPDTITLDLSLLKSFEVGLGQLQFRAEAFNLTNRANFGQPDMTAFIDGEPNANFGRITSTTTPARRIQLGLRWAF